MASAGEYVVAIFKLARVEIAESFVGEDFREANDGIERRAQLMAHVGQEPAFGEIGRFSRFLCVLNDVVGHAALGDVQKNTVGTHDPIARLGGQRPVMQPNPLAVFPAELVLHVELLAIGEKPAVSLADMRGVLGMDALDPNLPSFLKEFFGTVTEHLDGVAAHVTEIPI